MLSACVTNSRVTTKQYEYLANEATSEVKFWVYRFRNNGFIQFGQRDHTNKTISELTHLKSTNIFKEDETSSTVQVPADKPFKLFYRNISADSAVRKQCSDEIIINLDSKKKYEIQFVNWLKPDATFAEFTCELILSEILPDGSLYEILHHKQDTH